MSEQTERERFEAWWDRDITPEERAESSAELSPAKYHALIAWREQSKRVEELTAENAELRKDAARLEWIERRTKATSYPVMFAMLRNPGLHAGGTRIRMSTGVNSGPWAREYEAFNLRAAIDLAMEGGPR